MKHKPLKNRKLNFTFLIITVSVLTLFFIAHCYLHYSRHITSALGTYAEQDLAYNNSLSEKALNNSIQNIFLELHNLVSSYEDTTSTFDYSSFCTFLNNQSNRNNNGVLEFCLADTMKKELADFSSSENYRNFLKNIFDQKDQIYLTKQHKKAVQFAIPVIYKNELLGCITSTYSLTHNNDCFFASIFEGKGKAYITYYSENIVTPFADIDTFPLTSNANFEDTYSMQKLYKDLSHSKSGITHFNNDNKSYCAYYTPMNYDNLFLINVVSASILETRNDYFMNLTDNMIIKIIFCFLILLLFMIILQIYNNSCNAKSHNYLMLQQKRYNTILKHTQGSIWEYNISTDTIVKSDPDLGIYCGYSELSNIGNFLKNNTHIIHPDDYSICMDIYKKMQEGYPEISYELRAKDISGQYIWFEITGTTVTDQHGTPILVVGQTNNINERKQAYEELSENAKKDSLTKLYNRRSALDLINKELMNSNSNSIHALFMIDIDNFKSINDTYGHTFGDAVLLELSTKMTKTFSGKHILARFGGDEFIAFVSNVPSTTFLKELADKISKAFNSIYTDELNHQSITGSIGISVYPKDGLHFEDLFQKADMALYYSKSVGKNCFSFYTVDLMSSMEYLPSRKEDTPTHYLHTENRTIIDSSILYNTVDVLCDAKKLNTSINLMLNMIGNYYELDNLCIYELSDDNYYLDITFEWAISDDMKLTNYFNKIPIDIARGLEFYKNSSSGIFYHNTAFSLPYDESAYTETIKNLHTGSIFQCAIMEQGQHQGYIEAVRNSSEKPWTKIELDTITLTTKIIGSYLLKLRTQETANELAKKDMLTRSNNLFTFSEEASRIVENHPESQFVLLYTDINNFKYINENYGYSEGDQILRYFARHLNEMLNEDETYGRITADKFVALLKFENEGLLSIRLSQLNKQVNSIRKTLSDNYKISLIMGIYKIKSEDSDISFCVDRANIARKSITDRHKTKYAYFNDSMKSLLLKQKEIEDIMDDALKNEEFIIYYQPKFNLKYNTICGAEALVRWRRSNGDIIYPNDFISIFEDNGFIIELDFYVLNQVCKEIRQLLNYGKKIVPISVNFSRMHLQDRTFVSKLTTIVNEYKIPPNLIEVEITESALVFDNEHLFAILDDIHKHGFKLTMDDFGSGLSSLNLLRKLPFDVLKLDKDFFQKGAATKRERTIIEYIVKMALDLNMEIVSEGVETVDQAEFLKSISCPIVQGYLYEKPIPQDTFIEKYC